jgi:hypothetical protein
MSGVENLTDTIKPKSDQLNADDLLTGSITVTITGIRRGSADQPIVIDIDQGLMPYKPCKTMRRLLIMVWGENGREWVGRSMTLYNDPSVKWAGVAIGGIRISHVSHISQRQSFMLTATRGKKIEHTVQPLVLADNSQTIKEYMDADQDTRNKLWETYTPSQQAAINAQFNQG